MKNKFLIKFKDQNSILPKNKTEILSIITPYHRVD